jgi:hypothetical protein
VQRYEITLEVSITGGFQRDADGRIAGLASWLANRSDVVKAGAGQTYDDADFIQDAARWTTSIDLVLE